MREIIKKILREQTQQLPSEIRRRIFFPDDIMDWVKKIILNSVSTKSSVDRILKFSFKNMAYELLPYDDDISENYNDYIKIIESYLYDEYKELALEYLLPILNSLKDEPSKYTYVFWKHSELNGGNGFKESFNSWENLIRRYGSWLPINWVEVKNKLDTMEVGTKMISKPGENDFNYYFSIIKKINE